MDGHTISQTLIYSCSLYCAKNGVCYPNIFLKTNKQKTPHCER